MPPLAGWVGCIGSIGYLPVPQSTTVQADFHPSPVMPCRPGRGSKEGWTILIPRVGLATPTIIMDCLRATMINKTGMRRIGGGEILTITRLARLHQLPIVPAITRLPARLVLPNSRTIIVISRLPMILMDNIMMIRAMAMVTSNSGHLKAEEPTTMTPLLPVLTRTLQKCVKCMTKNTDIIKFKTTKQNKVKLICIYFRHSLASSKIVKKN